MSLLAQFLLRLAFGLALGMAITSPRQVSSGFYRNHLYVTLGLATLAGLSLASDAPFAMWLAFAAGVLSYVGSVCWLYEAKRAGVAALWLVAGLAFLSAVWGSGASGAAPVGDAAAPTGTSLGGPFAAVGILSSGLLLGLTCTAMLLGHWYLNAPGMDLAPLRRLLVAAGAAVVLQIVVSSWGATAHWQSGLTVPAHWVLLRWSFGIFGVAATLWMAWQTLKIPNTQSATGILYVSVIGAFVGELAASLLSAEAAYPL